MFASYMVPRYDLDASFKAICLTGVPKSIVPCSLAGLNDDVQIYTKLDCWGRMIFSVDRNAMVQLNAYLFLGLGI